MLQLATPPDRPRPALLASIGIHALAFSAFGLGPLVVFPDAPGWQGEVWAVTQPDLSAFRDAKPVDLRDRPQEPKPGRDAGRGGLPAASRGASATTTPARTLQPGPIPDHLPFAPNSEPPTDVGGPGVDGGFDDGTGTGPEPGDGPGGGGDVTGPIDVRSALPPDIVLPVPLKTPSPGYSDAARIARATGAVVLSATISSDGSVVDVTVENDAHPLLVRLAVEAVSRWRYVPARIGSRPVAVILRVTLTFRLV